MGTFFRRVKHRSSLGHRIDSARKYSLGAETPGPSLLGGTGTLTGTGTVPDNTPCCGSRPPAYPSFYTDGHVFRRVKHRSSLGHRIDSARKYSLGAETPGPSLLGGTGTLTAWRTPDLHRNWNGESDRCDRTRLDPELELMFLSRTDVVGLSCGSGTLERNSLAGLRDLHCLADSGTFSAWRIPGLFTAWRTFSLTAWLDLLRNRNSKDGIRKLEGTSGSGSLSLVRPEDGPG